MSYFSIENYFNSAWLGDVINERCNIVTFRPYNIWMDRLLPKNISSANFYFSTGYEADFGINTKQTIIYLDTWKISSIHYAKTLFYHELLNNICNILSIEKMNQLFNSKKNKYYGFLAELIQIKQMYFTLLCAHGPCVNI